MILRVKRTLIHNVINKHKIDSTSVSAFLENASLEDFLSTHYLLTQILTLFILHIKFFKLCSVLVECFIKFRHFVWIEECNVLFVLETLPKECTENNSIVHVTNTSFFGTLIILENNQVIKLIMPDRVEHSSTCIANAAL